MKYFFFSLLLLVASFIHAQQAPFQDEIDNFKKEDSAHFPPKNAVVFVGSSSFRFWSNVQDYFPNYTIINRGFGGSSITDVIYFANDIIFPYMPKQIVIYCGENDLAASDTVSSKMVLERFTTLFTLIRQKNKNVNIVFVSIKPSPSRAQLMPKMVEANRLIKQFLSKEKSTAFVDVYHRMLTAGGQPRAELFKEDMLHMKPAGYAIWKKAIAPFLLK